MKNIIKEIRTGLAKEKKRIQKDIDDTKDPQLKMLKMAREDIHDLVSKVMLIEYLYGIKISLQFGKREEPEMNWEEYTKEMRNIDKTLNRKKK